MRVRGAAGGAAAKMKVGVQCEGELRCYEVTQCVMMFISRCKYESRQHNEYYIASLSVCTHLQYSSSVRGRWKCLATSDLRSSRNRLLPKTSFAICGAGGGAGGGEWGVEKGGGKGVCRVCAGVKVSWCQCVKF